MHGRLTWSPRWRFSVALGNLPPVSDFGCLPLLAECQRFPQKLIKFIQMRRRVVRRHVHTCTQVPRARTQLGKELFSRYKLFKKPGDFPKPEQLHWLGPAFTMVEDWCGKSCLLVNLRSQRLVYCTASRRQKLFVPIFLLCVKCRCHVQRAEIYTLMTGSTDSTTPRANEAMYWTRWSVQRCEHFRRCCQMDKWRSLACEWWGNIPGVWGKWAGGELAKQKATVNVKVLPKD